MPESEPGSITESDQDQCMIQNQKLFESEGGSMPGSQPGSMAESEAGPNA